MTFSLLQTTICPHFVGIFKLLQQLSHEGYLIKSVFLNGFSTIGSNGAVLQGVDDAVHTPDFGSAVGHHIVGRVNGVDADATLQDLVHLGVVLTW